MIIGLSEQFRHSWKMKVKAMATITVPNACQDCGWGAKLVIIIFTTQSLLISDSLKLE